VHRQSAGAQSVDDRADVRVAPVSLLGAPLLYRATPSPRSVLRPVADFQYRRTERAHVEWPMAEAARSAHRARARSPRSAASARRYRHRTRRRRQATVGRGREPGAAVEGDYLIEVTPGAGTITDQKIVAIRVVR
jgi:hypothetical protein